MSPRPRSRHNTEPLTAAQIIEILSALPPESTPVIETWDDKVDLIFHRGIAAIEGSGRIQIGNTVAVYCEYCDPDSDAPCTGEPPLTTTETNN